MNGYPEIMAEYEATPSQRAAMDEIKSQLGPAPVWVAAQYLIREYPDDFDNTGRSHQIIAMNYGPPDTDLDSTPERRQKQMEVLEQEQQGQQESFEQEQQRKQKKLESDKENFQKHQQKVKENLQQEHQRIEKRQSEREQQREESAEPTTTE
jgi:septin family protein